MGSMEPTPHGSSGEAVAEARRRWPWPLDALSFVVIVAGSMLGAIVGAVLVLAWAALSGVVAGVVFKLAMKSVVMPLLGAPPVNQAYRDLTGNAAALPSMVLAVVIGAGFGEEVLFRGYLFERFGRWFGRSIGSSIAAVIVTTALFAAAHYSGQGRPGVEQALVTGLVFASVYARTRALPFVMIVHAAFDLAAVWLIYNGWETTVAHWFFK
jgi:membrane protease YdiL (CAAX protease family)